MIWCDTGGGEVAHIEDLAVFVAQLNAAGFAAAMDARAVAGPWGRSLQFDLAPWLREGPAAPGDRLAVIAAQQLGEARLAGMRHLAGGAGLACTAFGSFASRQAAIGAQARLAFALGCEPDVIDLATHHDQKWLGFDAPRIGVARPLPEDGVPSVLLVGPPLQDPRDGAALIGLSLMSSLRIAVLTDGKTKQAWTEAQGHAIPFYQYGEVPPASIAHRVHALALFEPFQKSYRLQSLRANVAVSGGVLLDCAQGHPIAAEDEAFVRAPVDLAGLGAFLASEILPNLARIGAHVRGAAQTRRLARHDALGPLAGLTALEPDAAPAGEPARIVFMPTNGVGLGHAQRCRLVAGELPAARYATDFAVFPSCMGLVRSYGFDAAPLVSRSPLHSHPHQNDLVNYLRLRSLTRSADAFVFDGGYVFDSVYRTILEHRLRAVWIRRGLWQKTQDNGIALDREKAFARVIVPAEAFAELNRPYSRGPQLRDVGPIVQGLRLEGAARARLRDEIGTRYGTAFRHLVVSQLGAGVAADRHAQLQAICAMLERRTDVLHLLVIWPTATVEAGWFCWQRSRVVRTLHAAVLAAAADLCISAAGYNSFHEAIYGGWPTIFLPQTGAFMDDQMARCRAAAERGLAGFVEPQEALKLERTVARMLDDGAGAETVRRLTSEALPAPGNTDAARLIEEIADGRQPKSGDLRPDRTARRG